MDDKTQSEKPVRRRKWIAAAGVGVVVCLGLAGGCWLLARSGGEESARVRPCTEQDGVIRADPAGQVVRWISLPTPHTFTGALEPGDWAVLGSRVQLERAQQSPGHKTVAVSANDQSIGVYRMGDLSQVWTGSVSMPVYDMAFSPDGALLATGSNNMRALTTGCCSGHDPVSAIVVRDARSGKVVQEFEGGLSAFHWSPDGQQIAIVTDFVDMYEQVTLYDARSGAQAFRIDRSSREMAWSPDGSKLAIGGEKGTVELRQAAGWALIDTLPPPPTHLRRPVPVNVLAIGWSPDGEQLAATVRIYYTPLVDLRFWAEGAPAANYTVIWDARTLTMLHVIPDTVFLDWSPDGKRFTTDMGYSIGAQKLWDAQTGRAICEVLPPDEPPYTPAPGQWWSGPEEITLADRPGDGPMVRLEDGTWLAQENPGGAQRWTREVCWSPDGAELAAVSEGSLITLWDMQTGQVITRLHEGASTGYAALAWSPDWSQLAVGIENDGHYNDQLTQTHDESTEIWDSRLTEKLAGFRGTGSYLSWSPDGLRLASGGQGGALRVWDSQTQTDRDLATLPGYMDDIAWSPDGKSIAVVSSVDPAQTTILDAASGEVIQAIGMGGLSLRWSPDGSVLAIGGNGYLSLVTLWNVRANQKIATLGPQGDGVTGMAWSPDGRVIATSFYRSRVVTLWDASTGEEIHLLDDLPPYMSPGGLDWSPDGNLLAAGSDDGQVTVWNVSPWLSVPGERVTAHLASEPMTNASEPLRR